MNAPNTPYAPDAPDKPDMPDAPHALSALCLNPGWIYEVVAGTIGENGPHAAPIGILTPDNRRLKAELYEGSATLANIRRNAVLGLSFVSDAGLLFDALYRRDALRFTVSTAGVPFVQGAFAWLEARIISSEESGGRTRIEAEAAHCRILCPGVPVNRAQGLLLESLVISTRLHTLPPGFARGQLLENARVIAKVAPGSRYETDMRELLALAGISG